MRNKIKIMILLIIALTNTLLFATTVISGPDLAQSLEIYSILTSNNNDPIFTFSTDTQIIYYSNDLISYESNDYDLSNSGQTETFYLEVYSNHNNSGLKKYDLSIYVSDQFHPVTTETAYPQIDINLFTEINNDKFRDNNKNKKYINLRNNYPKNSVISYNGNNVDATFYQYRIRIPSGLVDIELIRFYFSWDGYIQTVNQYWDMEGYVKIIIETK